MCEHFKHLNHLNDCLDQKRPNKSMSSKRGHPFYSQPKQWSFDETNTLMKIWSQIDFINFQTKSLCYKQIQIELKKQGFDRNSQQIRQKIKRLTSNQITQNNQINVCPTEQQNNNKVNVSPQTHYTDYTFDETTQESDDVFCKDYTFDYETHLNQNQMMGQISDQPSHQPSQRQTEPEDVPREEKQTTDQYINCLRDMSEKTEECFKQIMFSEEHLKQSLLLIIDEQMTRFTNLLNNNKDFELNFNHLNPIEPKSHQSSN